MLGSLLSPAESFRGPPSKSRQSPYSCTHTAAVGAAQDLSEVIAAVRDKAAYPSPLIAVGAMHSVTRCIEADQGTIVCMAGFDRIVGLAGAFDSAVQARPCLH